MRESHSVKEASKFIKKKTWTKLEMIFSIVSQKKKVKREAFPFFVSNFEPEYKNGKGDD